MSLRKKNVQTLYDSFDKLIVKAFVATKCGIAASFSCSSKQAICLVN